jgi:hypothetical protein
MHERLKTGKPKSITRADVLELETFAKVREENRSRIIALKASRRVAVGPFVTFHFENFDTMWWQIHEMLRVEKGGEAQIADELEAYCPLIPQGRELVATLMIEIENPSLRKRELARLGGIEDAVFLQVGGARIVAQPEHDLERTTEQGKTSALHFLRFRFTSEAIAAFRDGAQPAVLGIEHPNYGHLAQIDPETRARLAEDFD